MCKWPTLICYSSIQCHCAKKGNWWTNLTLKLFLNTTDWTLIYVSLNGATQDTPTLQSGPFCSASVATIKLYRPPTTPTPAKPMDKNIWGDKTIRRGCKHEGRVSHTPAHIFLTFLLICHINYQFEADQDLIHMFHCFSVILSCFFPPLMAKKPPKQ